MPEINAATGALTIPIWAVGAVAAVFLVLMMLAIAQAGTATVMHTLPRAVIVIAVACAGWLYIDNTNKQESAAVRRAFDERSSALLARAMAPGSALSCLNGLSGEAVEAACEKTVFAAPETVSAAVSYVTAQLDLLADGGLYAWRLDRAYFSQLGQLQSILQRDRFGIVAHVLATRGCIVEKCDYANLVGDPTQVLTNLRDHVFDANVAKFASAWNAGHGAAANAADAATARPAAAAAVSSQYDFPSADSIPPVNIMAPEPGSRNGTTAQAPSGVAPRQATAPVPPRRPPQHAPVAASRPAAPRPAAPVAIGETPTEGAATPATQ